jgi:hypothetical protein
MQTKNMIQASANVVKITRLSIGDVVKLVEEGYSEPEIYYGVVVDLLNGGEKSFVQIMRYKKSYGAVSCDIKTYSGDKDLTLFPATVEEVQEHLQAVIDRLRNDIKEEEKKLSERKLALHKAEEFVSMETSRKLTSSSFKEITQAEYLKLKEAQIAAPF